MWRVTKATSRKVAQRARAWHGARREFRSHRQINKPLNPSVFCFFFFFFADSDTVQCRSDSTDCTCRDLFSFFAWFSLFSFVQKPSVFLLEYEIGVTVKQKEGLSSGSGSSRCNGSLLSS